MDSIFLEVYMGLKIKGDTCVELEYVLKANVYKRTQDALQSRKYPFLLEARRIAADVEVQCGVCPSEVCCYSAGSTL